MRKIVIFAVMMMGSALSTPTILEKFANGKIAQDTRSEQVAGDAQNISVNNRRKKPSGRSIRIDANQNGQFVVGAKLNGHRSKVLVDTGATYVAINESTARKLGIHLKDGDFKYSVNTANGTVYVAAAMIEKIQIGRVRVFDVKASVSRDEQLKSTLLGMSFLNKLDKFVFEDKTLLLKQ